MEIWIWIHISKEDLVKHVAIVYIIWKSWLQNTKILWNVIKLRFISSLIQSIGFQCNWKHVRLVLFNFRWMWWNDVSIKFVEMKYVCNIKRFHYHYQFVFIATSISGVFFYNKIWLLSLRRIRCLEKQNCNDNRHFHDKHTWTKFIIWYKCNSAMLEMLCWIINELFIWNWFVWKSIIYFKK